MNAGAEQALHGGGDSHTSTHVNLCQFVHLKKYISMAHLPDHFEPKIVKIRQ